MESNFEGGSSGNIQTVSPDEASRALSAVAVDQEATRKAAMPPRWYLLLGSICIGVLFAAFAIPESRTWLKACILLPVIVIYLLIIHWFAKHQSVKKGRWALIVPLRPSSIPMIVVLVVLIALLLVEPITALAWWGHVCIGICVGAATYAVTSWTWRRWAEAPMGKSEATMGK